MTTPVHRTGLPRRGPRSTDDAKGDHVTTTSSPVRIVSIARRCRVTMRGLSDRAHAAGDAQARAMGWTTTRTPGPLGLDGRTYRDPRFDTLQRPA